MYRDIQRNYSVYDLDEKRVAFMSVSLLEFQHRQDKKRSPLRIVLRHDIMGRGQWAFDRKFQLKVRVLFYFNALLFVYGAIAGGYADVGYVARVIAVTALYSWSILQLWDFLIRYRLQRRLVQAQRRALKKMSKSEEDWKKLLDQIVPPKGTTSRQSQEDSRSRDEVSDDEGDGEGSGSDSDRESLRRLYTGTDVEMENLTPRGYTNV
jgi:hypothetical protein